MDPSIAHAGLVAGVIAWDCLVVWAWFRWTRDPIDRPPRAPHPLVERKARRWRRERPDDIVHVYRD